MEPERETPEARIAGSGTKGLSDEGLREQGIGSRE
jgi:hypothetical protein